MKEAKEFLELCRRRFPSPRRNQNHSLTLMGDTMVLTLMLGDTYQRFDLTSEDLSKPPAVLLAELVALFNGPQPRAPELV